MNEPLIVWAVVNDGDGLAVDSLWKTEQCADARAVEMNNAVDQYDDWRSMRWEVQS